jgi:hypothetical protein
MTPKFLEVLDRSEKNRRAALARRDRRAPDPREPFVPVAGSCDQYYAIANACYAQAQVSESDGDRAWYMFAGDCALTAGDACSALLHTL